MNEDSQTGQQDQELPSAGATLSAERKRQGLSLSDVARQIKLSPRQVEALERDDFATFRGALFVHGFLRNYCRLLKIDAVPLIKAADEVLKPAPKPEPDAVKVMAAATLKNNNMEQTSTLSSLEGRVADVSIASTASLSSDKAEVSIMPVRLVAMGVVALVIVAAGYFIGHPRSTEVGKPTSRVTPPAERTEIAEATVRQPAKSPVTSRSEELGDGTGNAGVGHASELRPVGESSVQTSAVGPVQEKRDAEPPKSPAVKPTEMQGAASGTALPGASTPSDTRHTAATNPNNLTLHIAFEQESWVEIKDASGKVIFAQLNPSGSDKSVTGAAPLSVLVGNANGVRITANDHSVNLEPHTRVNVARVTLP
jgi:cytoskeleton protein RodZ